jgi:hypothetical protein
MLPQKLKRNLLKLNLQLVKNQNQLSKSQPKKLKRKNLIIMIRSM